MLQHLPPDENRRDATRRSLRQSSCVSKDLILESRHSIGSALTDTDRRTTGTEAETRTRLTEIDSRPLAERNRFSESQRHGSPPLFVSNICAIARFYVIDNAVEAGFLFSVLIVTQIHYPALRVWVEGKSISRRLALRACVKSNF